MAHEPDAPTEQDDDYIGAVRCKFCGSTDVYWMTVLGRKEADFLAKNGTPRALHLAKAHLYNLAGGEHNCRASASPDEFDSV